MVVVWEATPGDPCSPPADLSSPPGVQLFGKRSLETPLYREGDEKKLKKRKIDKDYRQRIKMKKQKLVDEVEELGRKIAGLKSGIVSYQQDVDLTTRELQTKADQSVELRASIEKLKHDVAKGKQLLTILCRKPSTQKDVLECPDEPLQIALLKNVPAVLDESCNWEYERKCLEEEIAKLEDKNEMLQVQRQALREKIYKTRTEARLKGCSYINF